MTKRHVSGPQLKVFCDNINVSPFEQFTSSRSSGKEGKAWGRYGFPTPPPPWVLKGPKYTGSNGVNMFVPDVF